METTTIIAVPCFHRFDRLAGINVRKCEFKLATDGRWYHVVHFKEPVADAFFRWWSSVRCVHNARNEVAEIWERVSSVAVSSLYSIGPDAHRQVLRLLTVHVTKYVVNLVKDEIVNLVLCCSPASVGRAFLENVGSVIYANNELSFMQMNRFTLKSVATYKRKSKVKVLRKQLANAFVVLKCMYFAKKAKRVESTAATAGPSSSAACVETCKLKGFTERFLYADYGKLHWFFCRVYNPANTIENLLQLCRVLDDTELTECADEAVRNLS